VNVGHFVWLMPWSPEAMGGGARPYRQNTIVQRALSDLEPLTWPTRATIRRADERVEALREVAERTCRSGSQVVLVSPGLLDWRRAMWYLPGDIVVRLARLRPHGHPETLVWRRVRPETAQGRKAAGRRSQLSVPITRPLAPTDQGRARGLGARGRPRRAAS
jgi:hypothetical protein